MKIGTLTSGAAAVDTFTLQWCPQYLYYAAGTQLTSLKVNVLGEGTICDLDTAGLSSIGILMVQGKVTNGYLIPLATGLFKGKTTTITTTNSAAQTPVLYEASTNTADGNGFFINSTGLAALAPTGLVVEKFLSLHVPNAGATDYYNVEYMDGTVELNMLAAELPYWQMLRQYVSNSSSDYMFNNTTQTIKKVSIVPAANQTIYTTTLYAPGSKDLVTKRPTS